MTIRPIHYLLQKKLIGASLSSENVKVENEVITIKCPPIRQADILCAVSGTVKTVGVSTLIITDGYYDYRYEGVGAFMTAIKKIGAEVKAGDRIGLTTYGLESYLKYYITKSETGERVNAEAVLEGDIYQRPFEFATRREVYEIFTYLLNQNKNGNKGGKK